MISHLQFSNNNRIPSDSRLTARYLPYFRFRVMIQFCSNRVWIQLKIFFAFRSLLLLSCCDRLWLTNLLRIGVVSNVLQLGRQVLGDGNHGEISGYGFFLEVEDYGENIMVMEVWKRRGKGGLMEMKILW
ncbi:uncharacterized protein LOC127075019 isoform X2 [Lathyrus oleraceus]|uniref:uncharacterized protein LOC127075019 isoform X2 n=1 Tax=Pisum sativum TaxID=3888 RepID=UPI0021D30D35|nr:uncharacterized protein LOC127075019 isoform X2 [Pisum sativum]